MPQSSEDEPDGDDAARKSRRGEELANGEEVRDTSNCQRNEEGEFTHAGDFA